jgi:anti-anti-sigma factor
MESDEQGVAIIEPEGTLDSRAAEEVDHATADSLRGGARFFVIGFEKVDLMTGAGVRILLELTRKLQAQDGALVLYGLNDRVRTVLSVTRLIDRFRIVVSKDDAMREIAMCRASATSRTRVSSLTRLVGQMLGSGTGLSTAELAPPGFETSTSSLTLELQRLLKGADE